MSNVDHVFTETIVAFFSFVTFRYFLVNFILGTPLSLSECAIKALCFALSVFFMKMSTHLIVNRKQSLF